MQTKHDYKEFLQYKGEHLMDFLVSAVHMQGLQLLLEFIELFYWNIRQFSSRVLEKSLKLYFFHIYTWKTAEICKEVKLTTWVMAFQLERIHQPVSPRQFPVKCYYRVLENMVSGPGIVPSKLKQFCKLTALQYKACQCVCTHICTKAAVDTNPRELSNKKKHSC